MKTSNISQMFRIFMAVVLKFVSKFPIDKSTNWNKRESDKVRLEHVWMLSDGVVN